MIRRILFYNFLFCFLFASDFIFKEIPIQTDGRIKPLDTYARNQLLNIYSKRSIEITATEWIIELLTNQSVVFEREIFKIHNSEVVHALGLPPNKKHVYSYNSISDALKNNEQLINEILSKPEDSYTLVEKQIVNLYLNHLRIFDLAHSLSCIIPAVSIDANDLSDLMKIEMGTDISYLHFISSISDSFFSKIFASE